MMKKIIPYIIIVVLSLVILVLSLTNTKTETVEKCIVDTVSITVVDTFIERKPMYVYSRITDTMVVYVDSSKTVRLPITQNFYSGEYYQLWVSGYKPKLDSINVFNNTVTKTVTNTVERTVYADRTEWYVHAGSMFIGNDAAPYMGANVSFKNGITLGADIGYYNKKSYYGFNVGFKLK